MSADCPVCLAVGWEAQTRMVRHATHVVVATLNVTTSDLLAPDEASLSDVAWRELGAVDAGTSARAWRRTIRARCAIPRIHASGSPVC